jgi:hypothetical protein
MEIANLMLIDTRPVAWDDPYASDCMTDFLLSLLDPEKPGLRCSRAGGADSSVVLVSRRRRFPGTRADGAA